MRHKVGKGEHLKGLKVTSITVDEFPAEIEMHPLQRKALQSEKHYVPFVIRTRTAFGVPDWWKGKAGNLKKYLENIPKEVNMKRTIIHTEIHTVGKICMEMHTVRKICAVEMTGFENVLSYSELPEEYQKGLPIYYGFYYRGRKEIRIETKDYITYLTTGYSYDKSEFEKYIRDMKKAGHRLGEILKKSIKKDYII